MAFIGFHMFKKKDEKYEEEDCSVDVDAPKDDDPRLDWEEPTRPGPGSVFRPFIYFLLHR